MVTVKEKVEQWVEKNPNGYLEKSYEKIGKEIGITGVSVSRHLPEIIAKRDGCLPSEVQKKRDEHGLKQISEKMSDEKIKEILKLSKKHPPMDVAYIMKISIQTVKKYIKQDEEKTEETNPPANSDKK